MWSTSSLIARSSVNLPPSRRRMCMRVYVHMHESQAQMYLLVCTKCGRMVDGGTHHRRDQKKFLSLHATHQLLY